MTAQVANAQEQVSFPHPVHGAWGEGGAAFGAGDLFAMIRRRIVLIVVLFVLFSAMAVGGFATWWSQFPGYRSEALIECISNIPQARLTPEQERLRKDEHERFVLTQAQLLKSPGVLREALKLTVVRETDWWKTLNQRQWKRPDEHLIELIEQLSAQPVRGTNFLRVSMECRNPQDPKVIVSAVVDQWYEMVKRRSAEEFVDANLDAAQRELEQLDREISDDQDRLRTIAQRLPAGARMGPAASLTSHEAAQYAEQVAVHELELALLEQYRSIYNDPQGPAATAEDRAVVEQDPRVAELARALYLLEQQRAADAKVYGAGHSVLRQLDAQIESLEERLVQLRFERLEERRADIQEQVNTAYESTRHALFLAQENLAKAEAALQHQDRLLLEFTTLQEDVEEKRTYRTELTTYIKGLTRVKAQRTAINVNVAQEATDPLGRSSPSLLLLPVGVFFALCLSLGIALATEMLDTSIRTTQDLVRYANASVLGAVPDIDDEEVPIARVETAVTTSPKSMVAEVFRQVRTNLQFAAPAEKQRTLLVTSPQPGDGKTTVAGNLAIAGAQTGRRVLLIDANFRRPALHAVFESAATTGLSNLLAGEGDLSSHVSQTSVPGLDLLACGPTPANPVELLSGPACQKLLEDAAGRYDQVIFDTPPILLTADALVLAPAVDGVVLVVRANVSARGIARRASTLLADVGANLFGVVLNAAQVRRGGYFREQLQKYYEYQT
ncbi:MAG: polysaccharide biosynthesis tyrosine autokinase [Phycisphaerae bacterium]